MKTAHKRYSTPARCALGLAIGTIWLAARVAALGADGGASPSNQPPFAISHGPFLQAPSSTGMTVSWATTRPAVSWVEYRLENDDHWLTNYPARHGLIEARKTFHNVPLAGLKPGGAYVYRAVSKEIVNASAYSAKFGETEGSQDARFSTLSDAKKSFSFVTVSDRHERTNELRASWGAVDWKNVDLTFLVGDMVNASRDGDQFFRCVIDPCVEHFSQTKPVVYVRGNHETRGVLARSLLDYFPTDSNRYYYTLRHGPVMFVVLDCGEDKIDGDKEYFGLVAFKPYMEEQARWLAKQIKEPAFQQAPFRVCLLHIPPAKTENTRFAQTRWLWDHIRPLLNEGKVDLLLCGHTHRDASQDKGIEEFNFPLVVSGTETVVRCDVTSDEIRVSRQRLSGEPLANVLVKRAAK